MDDGHDALESTAVTINGQRNKVRELCVGITHIYILRIARKAETGRPQNTLSRPEQNSLSRGPA